MAQSVTMTYGDYEFTPVPFITIKRNNIQVRNREYPVGFTFQMTLNGTLTPLPDGHGLLELDDLVEQLRLAFNRDGKLLEIMCDATVVMQLYPRIIDIDFQESSNNWTDTIPYTITLEYDADEFDEDESGEIPPYIEEYSEEWNMEWVEDHKYFTWDLNDVVDQVVGYDYDIDTNNSFEVKVSHSINVKGKQSWSGPGVSGEPTSAVDNALSWLNTIFNDYGYDATAWGHSLSGWNNLPFGTGDYGVFDHFRTHTINETDGTVSLSESWYVIGSNSGLSGANGNIVEDFSISIRDSLENGNISISIEGTIKGLEQRLYGGVVDTFVPPLQRSNTATAYAHAVNAWGEIQNRVFPRAQMIYQQDYGLSLNPSPLNRTIAHNPSKGTITYNYEFNDRPCSFITGSLSENFTIVDNNPTDVFARLTVLGRPYGPVLQELSTVTERTREVTIEVVMPPPEDCSSISDLNLNKPTSNVNNLLCEFEEQLTSVYDQVFKTSDVVNWSPLSGRYSRAVAWTYQDCDNAPDTSFC